MTSDIIEPVHKTLHVKTSPRHAFDVFTAELGRWWPSNSCTGNTVHTMYMEPRLGGRWLEIAEDGSEKLIATVTVWEPPHRLVLLWQVNIQFTPDPSSRSEVEVRFTSDEQNGTLVELLHHRFASMTRADGTKLRDAVEAGWPKILALYAAKAESDAGHPSATS